MGRSLCRVVGLFCSLLALFIVSTPLSFAQAPAPQLVVLGGAPVVCQATGQAVPTVVQNTGTFNISLRNMPFGGAALTITLPDGRVYQPAELAAPGFNGVIDLPLPTVATIVPISGNVNAFGPYNTAAVWPTGCYTVTATSLAAPTVRPQGRFVLTAPAAPTNPGAVSLFAVEQVSRQATAQQRDTNVTVEIMGRGVATNSTVALSVRQPNGSVLAIPLNAPGVASGGFSANFALSNNHQAGTYTFVALVTPRSGSGSPPLRATAQFNFTAQNFAPLGDAQLDIFDIQSLIVPQGNLPATPAELAPSIVTIEGHQFTPLTLVDLVVIKPNGARLNLAPYAATLPAGTLTPSPLTADANGDLLIEIPFSRQLPLGEYTIIASAPAGGPATERAIARVRLVAP